MSQTYFAVTPPGLEPALQRELRALKARKCTIVRGGVEFQATRKVFYRVMHRVRQANHVHMRLDTFRARDTRELHRKVRRMDWARLVQGGAPIEVRVTTVESATGSAGDISRSTFFGIRDHLVEDAGLAEPELVGKQDRPGKVRVMIRVVEQTCTVSLAANTELLHHRGWRVRLEEAPLRETFACSLLDMAGWQPGMPLLDPVCGSGTFVIEAARQVAGLPPRERDAYSFHAWADFDAETWAAVVDEDVALVPGAVAVPLVGRDIRPRAVASCEANALEARVGVLTSFEAQSVVDMMPPCDTPGVVIANAPFGVRVQRGRGRDAVDRVLVERFAESFEGWTLGLLLPRQVVPADRRLAVEEQARFSLGGQPVRFWTLRHHGATP